MEKRPIALIVLTNNGDIEAARAGLKKAGVNEDPTTGVFIAGTVHDGGALRRLSAVYAADGSKLSLQFRKLAETPADQLPAAK